MDIVSDKLFNILQVEPGEDLEDIYDGNFAVVCQFLLNVVYYRSTKREPHLSCRTLIITYLLLVVVGLEKLDALNAPLFTSVKSILEHVDRLRHDH